MIQIIEAASPFVVALVAIFVINQRAKESFRFRCSQIDLAPIVRELQFGMGECKKSILHTHAELKGKTEKLDEMITKLTLKGM